MVIFELEKNLKQNINIDKKEENLKNYSKSFGLPIAYVLPTEKLMFIKSPYQDFEEFINTINIYTRTLWRTYRQGNNLIMYIEFQDFICKLDVDKTILNSVKNLEPEYFKINKEELSDSELKHLVAETIVCDTENILKDLNTLQKFLADKLSNIDVKHYLMNILLLIQNEQESFQELLENNRYKQRELFNDISKLLDVVIKPEQLRLPFYFESTFLNKVSKKSLTCYKNINLNLFGNQKIVDCLLNLFELVCKNNYNKQELIYYIYVNKNLELPIKHIRKKTTSIKNSVKNNYYTMYHSEYSYNKTAKQKVMYYELFLNRRFVLTENNFLYGLFLVEYLIELDKLIIEDLKSNVSNSIYSKLSYRFFTIPSKYANLNKLLAVQMFNFITDAQYSDIQEEYFEYADYIYVESLNKEENTYKTYKQLKTHILKSMYDLEPKLEGILDDINYENHVSYLGILDKNILSYNNIVGVILCSNIFKEWVNIGATIDEKVYLAKLFKVREFTTEELSILSNIYTKFKYNVNKLLFTHSINDIITNIDNYKDLQDIWLDLNDIVEDLLDIKDFRKMDKIEYIYKQILSDNT